VNIRLVSTPRAAFSGDCCQAWTRVQGHVLPSLLPLKVDFTFLPGSVSLSSVFCRFSPSAITKSNQHQALQPASQQSNPFDSQTSKLRFSGRTPLFSRTQYHLFLFTKYKPFCFPPSDRQAKLNRQAPIKEKHYVHQRH